MENNKAILSLSTDQINFLESHKAEIEQMYEDKIAPGGWIKLGEGLSKIAFKHPDLPGMLIKIPHSSKIGFRGATGEDDLRIQHAAIQQIRSVAAQFDRIVIPESHLYPTEKGLILIEQRFDLRPFYYNVPDSPEKQEAIKQFKEFVQIADVCDLILETNHNAGIIYGLPIKIGVFDVDCRESQVNQKKTGAVWDWDFRGDANRNQAAAFALVLGMAILGGAAAVAKITSVVNPRKVLELGFGVGGALAMGGGAAANNVILPADPMIVAGNTMFVIGAAAIPVIIAYFLVKKVWNVIARSD